MHFAVYVHDVYACNEIEKDRDEFHAIQLAKPAKFLKLIFLWQIARRSDNCMDLLYTHFKYHILLRKCS